MNLSKYTGYFHEGSLINFKHEGNKIEISMLSTDIIPEHMIENMPPLNKFEEGMILPQYPEKKVYIAGELASYSEIPTIRDELSQLILENIESNNQLSCVFDDVLRSAKDKPYDELTHSQRFIFKNEVYYIIRKQQVSLEIINRCLDASNAFWHSLCLLTRTNLSNLEPTLTVKEIEEICINAELILVGSYDGEGYMFWEKPNSNFHA